jgi:hypothetical protein
LIIFLGPISKINHTDKKEKKIVLICEEILNGAVEKSCMRKGFPHEEMRKYLTLYEAWPLLSHI